METVQKFINDTKQAVVESFKLLWRFKWYILPYVIFYSYLWLNYMSPSPKNYCLWNNEVWYNYNIQIYLAVTRLMLIIYALLFLIGTSNMRNHPRLAKLIFLSSLVFLAVYLEIV